MAINVKFQYVMVGDSNRYWMLAPWNAVKQPPLGIPQGWSLNNRFSKEF
jgi:hypothetical protein